MGRGASTGRGRGRGRGGRGRGAAAPAKERTAAAKARAAQYQRERRAAAKAAAAKQTRGRGRGSAKAAAKGRGRGSASNKEEAVRKKAAKTRAAVEKKRGSLEEHVDKSEPGKRRSSRVSLALKDEEEPRRRLVKKQPMAPPPSSRKRPAPESSQSHREGHSRASREARPPDESVSGGPFRGHYDVLQLRRSANAAEVREGFRRKALATHPDKGGRPEDFRAVVTAFEVLSDGARRAEYDKSLIRNGNTDGLVAPEVLAARQAKEAPIFEAGVQDQYYELQAARRAQREAIIRLTSTASARRQAFLKTLSSSMLQGIAQWLTASATRSMQPPSDGAIAGSSAHGKAAQFSLAFTLIQAADTLLRFTGLG
jgi:hypothetical protein